MTASHSNGLDSSPAYSICITNLNSAKTIKESFENISPLAQWGFEIVAVDGKSSDDSISYLKNLREKGIIQKISVERCGRGEGQKSRLFAFDGEYLLSNIEMDVVYD